MHRATLLTIAVILGGIASAIWPVSAGALPAGFQESTAVTGLTQPTDFEFASDGRVFIAEKRGLIKVLDSVDDTTPTIFADLRTQVYNTGDSGLLGLTVHPDFAANPQVYALYTRDAVIGGTAPRWNDVCPDPPGLTTDGCVVSGRLSRLQASGGTWDGTEHVLVEDWCQQHHSHSVASLAFGSDGALYVSAGEGANPNFADYGQRGLPDKNPCGDPPVPVGGTQAPPSAEGGALRSQDLRTPSDPTGGSGTVLRIDPMTGAAFPGNPLSASPDPMARRIIAHGLRNPFRIAPRPGTPELWIGEVGWNNWEEINRIGAVGDGVVENFGWPCYEGVGRQPGWDAINLTLCENLYAQPGAVTAPLFSYSHSATVHAGDTCPTGTSAPSGLAFAPTVASYPAAYQGALFFADYARGCIWAMLTTNGAPDPARVQAFHPTAGFPVSLRTGPGGDLFYADIAAGTIRRITHFAANGPPQAVITADRTSGPVPLSVAFDGSGSSDPDGDALTYAWDLDGDGEFDDAATVTAAYVYEDAGARTVRLRVSDPAGASDEDAVVVTAGNSRPTARIDAPLGTLTWRVGDPITFSGGADDDEEGALPASALSWSVIIHHCSTPTACHEHVVQTLDGVSSGSFPAPDHGYPSHLEFRLTATDAGGLTGTASVLVHPRTAELTLSSSPAGAGLSLNSESATAPFTRTVILGSRNSVAAPLEAILAGGPFTFFSWSDGGAAAHDVVVDASTTLAATYLEATGGRFLASGGLLVVEAEHQHEAIARSGRSWSTATALAGFVADGYQTAMPDGGISINNGFATTSPQLRYRVNLDAAGTWYVWLRASGPNNSGDSAHVGLDGLDQAGADRMVVPVNTGGFVWSRATIDGPVGSLSVAAAGQHTLDLWMREDGARVDRILLTRSSTLVPSGAGPPESARSGGDVVAPTVVGRTPVDGAIGIARSANVVATFSEAMDPASVVGAFTLATAQGAAVAASVSAGAGNTEFTLDPSADLQAGTTYRATIGVGARDVAGNSLAAPVTWTFTTQPDASGEHFLASGGLLVVEAEHQHEAIARSGKSWSTATALAGFVAEGYRTPGPDSGTAFDSGFATTSPEQRYRVSLDAAGTWYVWLRASGPNTSGDSAHVGLDGVAQASADRMVVPVNTSGFTWSRATIDGPRASLSVAAAGQHTLNLWMREDGARIDRVLLTTSAALVPSGAGPPESARSGG